MDTPDQAESALLALSDRLDRLESIEEIRQLAAKYSLALDMRDSAAWVGLFPEDIRVGDGQVGRSALRAWFEHTMRNTFTGTAHHIGGHLIEMIDQNNAQGVVYSKNEHETKTQWVIMQMMYFDRYERIHGRWYFRRRLPLYWYASDLNQLLPHLPHQSLMFRPVKNGLQKLALAPVKVRLFVNKTQNINALKQRKIKRLVAAKYLHA